MNGEYKTKTQKKWGNKYIWNKISWKKVKGADGYRVQLYLKAKTYILSEAESGWYYWDTKSTSKTMKIAGYASDPKWYDAYTKVKIRAYKKGKNGKKLFGKWSKTITTKYR